MNSREIGGFLQLELPIMEEYHNSCIRLNSARNCLLYLINNMRITKIFIPIYICNSIVDIVKLSGIEYEFYEINSDFLPRKSMKVQENEYIFYVNYFGINNYKVELVCNRYKNIIIDNTQAFFYNKVKENSYYIYSPRKFFGVADGGYLKGNIKEVDDMEYDISSNRLKHLIERIEFGAQKSYNNFIENELYIDTQSIKKMSNVTKRILESIDYNNVREIRNTNFKYLHSKLGKINDIKIDINYIDGPMVYPLLIENEKIKSKLIEKKVFIPTYWKEALERCKEGSFEEYITKYLISIPIDQRYNINDMEYIINIIKESL